MENHGILGWRRRSTVRKAQILGGATGASVTIIVLILAHLDLGLAEHSPASDFLFHLWLILFWPTYHICRAFQIPEVPVGLNWLVVVEIIVNTLICVFLGTIVGWLLGVLKRMRK